METETMEKVVVTAMIENLGDLYAADEYPVLVGQIALEALDWVVDAKGQRLIGNPDHGGEWGVDAF